jgi:hypothetical protein
VSALASSAPRALARPATIVAAIAVTIFSNSAGFIGFVLPGSDDIPTAAIILGSVVAVVSLLLCWPLWNGKRWAAITLTVITGLNTLSSVPGLFASTVAIGVFVGIGIVLTAIQIWLTWHPESRRFYRAA